MVTINEAVAGFYKDVSGGIGAGSIFYFFNEVDAIFIHGIRCHKMGERFRWSNFPCVATPTSFDLNGSTGVTIWEKMEPSKALISLLLKKKEPSQEAGHM